MSIQKYATALILCAIALFGSAKSDGQIVIVTDHQKEANVKVFVTQYMMDADVVVYKTPFVNNSVDNKGQWYFTKNEGEVNKKIFFIRHREEADLIVYFTTKSSEAGWKKKKKSYIME